MANVRHTVVNTELMTATDVRSKMRSFRIGTGTGKDFTPVDADNGTVVTLGALIDANQDLWEATPAAKSAKLGQLVLVTTPEICYDEREKTLDCFYNEAGANATGMILVEGDIFSESVEGFESAPTVGQFIGVGTNGKLAVSASAPSSGAIGKCIDIKYRNGIAYYGVQVG